MTFFSFAPKVTNTIFYEFNLSTTVFFFCFVFCLFCFYFCLEGYRRFGTILTTTSKITNLGNPKNIACTHRLVVEKGSLIQMILGNFKETVKEIMSVAVVVVFLASFLVYQVTGISALPVMGANGSLLLDLDGIARHVQIMTCAHSAT